ncbi:MAG: DsbA family protein [Gammaproteobacteria bacterium]|nr:DsbA family protein [Gammaproteobacteria bacterium]
MFKNLLLGLSLIFGLLACTPEPKNAETQVLYKEGIDYRVVSGIGVDKLSTPFIIEYFWLGCPHCQAFEQPLEHFLSANPDFKVIKRPAGGGARWTLDAKIFYGLEHLNKLAHLPQLFDLYRGKQVLPNKQVISEFLQSIEIEPPSFFELINTNAKISARVAENVKEMAANQLKGVPAIIVNGKYLVTAGPDTDFFGLVKYLSAL